MENEGGPRLSKRFSDKGGEVDNQTKSGTAWSHSFLNQKPWHPLSYPNQRRKWIAEQIQAQHDRRAQEVSREFAQEQEFFRQAALISKKDKEKIETMKAVSFMYVRPPGYNPESAKAAELADESMRDGQQPAQTEGGSTSMPPPGGEEGKKKARPKDVFGRNLPTENEFEVLKNAPRMETGLPTRAKPFGVEVRNVKCVRCNTFGHQSGDRECPLKDAIMPNEESRLKRDDPLTAILAHTDPSEPLKWELKQKPGISPPRGGFRADDPNQQIVAEDDDIFDEYGGFLGESVIPELLANFSSKPKKKSKKKNKRKPRQSPSISGDDMFSSEDDKKGSHKKVSKLKKKKRGHSESSSPEIDRHKVKNKQMESYLSEDANDEKDQRRTQNRPKHSHSNDDSHMNRWQHRLDKNKDRDRDAESSEDSEPDQNQRATKHKHSHSSEEPDGDQRPHRSTKDRRKHSYPSKDSDDYQRHQRSTKNRQKHSYSTEDSDGDERHDRSTNNRLKHSHSYKESQISRRSRREKIRNRSTSLSEDSEADRHPPSDERKHQSRHQHYEDSESERRRSSDKRRQRSKRRQSYSFEDSDEERQHRSRDEPSRSHNDTDLERHHSRRNNRNKH